MCGYIGKISTKQLSSINLEVPNKLIECRGPDSNVSINGNDEIINYSLNFNRLAIVDLNNSANQPMQSQERDSILLFNGEIFNHLVLRKELIEKHNSTFLTSHSDTETLLNGLDIYGEKYIKNLRGQFAITYIDKKNKKIILSRDRVGQKPLYFYHDKNNLNFSSNLKSLVMISEKYKLNETQIYEYLNLGATTSPNTIFKNIYKVEPAETIIFDYSSGYFKKITSNYWDPASFVGNIKFDEDEFYNIFSEAVKIRTYSDVPIASFLSGGIDSTSIVKNLYENNLDVDTFTVQMDSSKYDESFWSNQVVSKYNTNHNSIKLKTDINFLKVESIVSNLDEPFADPSIVPTFLISEKIAESYKVAISGDGGDELLGGYYRTNHVMFNKRFNFLKYLNYIYPPHFGSGNRFLSHSKDNHASYASFLEDKNLLSILGIDSNDYKSVELPRINVKNKYKNLLLYEYKYYLPEMMMYKVDRMSMANSLEVRSPFVDNKIIEYIFSHDTPYLNQNNSKQLLKKYLQNDFNNEFINRKKQGFSFNLEGFVYKNISEIMNTINNGSIVSELNKNAISKILKIKSRINANRIWKLYILEDYLSRI